MQEDTQEQQKNDSPEPDLQERQDGFNKDLQPLLGKYELALTAVPLVMPDGRLAARPAIVSTRVQKETESPKAEDKIIKAE